MNYKRKNNNKSSNSILKKYISKLIVQILICTILVLSTLITVKKSNKIKSLIKQNVYEKNINFASFNNLYKKYFGSNIPFSDKIFKEQQVFNEELKYYSYEEYKNGVKLTVDNNYLVPVLESGIVVFEGIKEDYGNIIIIQTTSGIDYWYGNIQNLNVKLYDYVEKGQLIGEASSNKIYLTFIKDGKYLDYKNYL